MNFCQIYCILWPTPSRVLVMEGHLSLTEQNFPVEHEHEMGDVAEDENPQRPGPLSRVDAQFRVRGLEKLLYTV